MFNSQAVALTVVIIIWFIGSLCLFIGANSRNQSGIIFSMINLLGLAFTTLIFGPLFKAGGAGLSIFVGFILTNIGFPIFLIKDSKQHKEYVERRRKEPVHSIKEREPEPWDGPVIPEDPFQGDERLRALFEKDDWFTLMQEIKKLHKAAEAMGDQKVMYKYDYMRKWVTEERDRRTYEKQAAQE